MALTPPTRPGGRPPSIRILLRSRDGMASDASQKWDARYLRRCVTGFGRAPTSPLSTPFRLDAVWVAWASCRRCSAARSHSKDAVRRVQDEKTGPALDLPYLSRYVLSEPLRQAALPLHRGQIRSPTQALSKEARQIKQIRERLSVSPGSRRVSFAIPTIWCPVKLSITPPGAEQLCGLNRSFPTSTGTSTCAIDGLPGERASHG
jgi:hypothetical protein